VPFATLAAVNYILDCHPKDANSAFVTIGFSTQCLRSLRLNGLQIGRRRMVQRSLMNGIAGLNIAISVLTIPIYIFGKRSRSCVKCCETRVWRNNVDSLYRLREASWPKRWLLIRCWIICYVQPVLLVHTLKHRVHLKNFESVLSATA
jgi:hypothetical protein